METRKSIEKYFNTDRNYLDYINKYEENKIFFNELLSSNKREDLEFVLPIKIYKYADSLNHTGNYSKALEVAYEIEADLKKIRGISKHFNLFQESVTFLKGVCLRRIKKYKESNIEFKKALEYNPTNDKYIHWYKSNIIDIIDNYLKIAMILGLILLAITYSLQFFDVKLPFLLRIFGAIILVISSLFSFLTEKIINKINFKFKKISPAANSSFASGSQ